MDVSEITQMMFDPRCLMSGSDPKHGKILTASALFRGEQISTGDVEMNLKKLGDKHAGQFVEWIPNRMMTSICKVNPAMRSSNISGTIISNSTSIQSSMRRLVNSFDKMYKKKAFLHWYTEEGMDIQEFEEARQNLNDLISEYQQY